MHINETQEEIEKLYELYNGTNKDMALLAGYIRKIVAAIDLDEEHRYELKERD